MNEIDPIYRKGNEGCQGHNHEEWKAGKPGCMPGMWDKDVQDWKEAKLVLQV